MQISILYIPYDAPSYEQTGDMITFAKFEEGNLVENECNVEEDESILASIDDLSAKNDSNDISISDNHL